MVCFGYSQFQYSYRIITKPQEPLFPQQEPFHNRFEFHCPGVRGDLRDLAVQDDIISVSDRHVVQFGI